MAGSTLFILKGFCKLRKSLLLVCCGTNLKGENKEVGFRQNKAYYFQCISKSFKLKALFTLYICFSFSVESFSPTLQVDCYLEDKHKL